MVKQAAHGLRKNKGMWEGRKGLSEGREYNQPRRDSHTEELTVSLNSQMETLQEVERLIDEVGVALSISQPPLSGKIGIRWWNVAGAGNDRYREPVLVKWMKQKNGAMTPKESPRPRASRNGNFAINYAETCELLKIAKTLIAYRSEIKQRLYRIAKMLERNTSLYIHNNNSMIDQLRYRVVKNLLDRGYEVEEKYLEGFEFDE